MPQISAGIDIAKEVHWITAIDDAGTVLIDHALDNDPAAIAALIDELAALDGAVRVGFDVIGGIAGLAEAMLAASGCTLLHVPGLAVNRARQGTVGGENKSDPRDARTIADQVRSRRDLRVIEPQPRSTSSSGCSSAGVATSFRLRPSASHACAICSRASSPPSNARWI
jgi:Transposase.